MFQIGQKLFWLLRSELANVGDETDVRLEDFVIDEILIFEDVRPHPDAHRGVPARDGGPPEGHRETGEKIKLFF